MHLPVRRSPPAELSWTNVSWAREIRKQGDAAIIDRGKRSARRKKHTHG